MHSLAEGGLMPLRRTIHWTLASARLNSGAALPASAPNPPLVSETGYHNLAAAVSGVTGSGPVRCATRFDHSGGGSIALIPH